MRCQALQTVYGYHPAFDIVSMRLRNDELNIDTTAHCLGCTAAITGRRGSSRAKNVLPVAYLTYGAFTRCFSLYSTQNRFRRTLPSTWIGCGLFNHSTISFPVNAFLASCNPPSLFLKLHMLVTVLKYFGNQYRTFLHT